jgi:hypothetical protein
MLLPRTRGMHTHCFCASCCCCCPQKLSFSAAEVKLVPLESITAVERSIADFNKAQQDKVRAHSTGGTSNCAVVNTWCSSG